MKLVTFASNSVSKIGALVGDEIIDLNQTDSNLPTSMIELLQGGDVMMSKAQAAATAGVPTYSLEGGDVKLQSPVPNPSKILAVGLNYVKHIMEIPEETRKARGFSIPESPVIFNKQSTSANGPYDPIHLPLESHELDYEAELGVVIGKECRRVKPEDAFTVVAGYTIINDVTIREWQRAAPTMTMGKSWDTHCPMGPCLVTTDEITDPHNLNIRLTVDGEERQNYNTSEMHFKIDALIAYLSTAFTLRPGDIIATGTSAGVAVFMEGQPWLEAGQSVRVEADQIGHIENKVVPDQEAFIR